MKMNPFNIAWIVLVWLAAGASIMAYYEGDTRLTLLIVVMFAILITGETIGADRAERDFEAALASLQRVEPVPPTPAMQEAAAMAMAEESAGYDWERLSAGGKDRYRRILTAALTAMRESYGNHH